MNNPSLLPLFQAPIEDGIKNPTYDDDSGLDMEPEIAQKTPPLPDSDADVVVDKKTADKRRRANRWKKILHPPVLGKFRCPDKQSAYASSACTNMFKYHIVSLHFPREHHYLDGGASPANPPWIAKVTLFLRDVDTLTENKDPLPWRNHRPIYHEGAIPPPGVDRDSHPGADKAAPMFKQSWKIDFGPDHGLSWRAEVTLWAQKEETIREVLHGWGAIQTIINKETNVCMEAFRTEPAAAQLWPRRRFFLKYPEHLDLIDATDPSWVVPELGSRFCIARDKTVEVDEPELAKVMEGQMERHLFGEDHGPGARILSCNVCSGVGATLTPLVGTFLVQHTYKGAESCDYILSNYALEA
ncbi:hypothetical protein QBC37DRAFT_384853 [Rhypophila decipiens]|uniref:Uncharacterized protein n=1 Tax=Rhypophila decipiens TaxID=261697 RepID=A0AAN6YCU2_9PEZI|nr:hypothetical protein QBC37DRAFT_384853 [Rhypophila decipiens]